jgi:uncharacterized protein (TIGR02266 family)
VRLVVDIDTESNFYLGFTDDLSEEGVFVATHAPRSIGSKVDLAIVIAGSAPIRTTGTIRWHRPWSEVSDSFPGMGIRFDDLSGDDAARIRQFAKAREPMFLDDGSRPQASAI